MKISWMGHSCFLLETILGTKIITDPYEPGGYGGAVGYSALNISADIVTVSHQHTDHNYCAGFKSAKIIDTCKEVKVKEVLVRGVPSFHDESQGRERGHNIIFIFETENLKIAHFGDLGTLDINYDYFKDIDVALIPVGGTFTIDAGHAQKLIENISPQITVPMHFKTKKLGFNIDKVDKFLKDKAWEEKDILDINRDSINSFKRIVVLRHQR
ncbi:MAG: MBL fold metallo-hydrolase [Candidatus Omnitrophica bacterium]|nr:MBL fold metallo-hydrolase [Candidatus Omnitrophota bacterium]